MCGGLSAKLAAPMTAPRETETKTLHKQLFDVFSSCRLSHDRILAGIFGRSRNAVGTVLSPCGKIRGADRPPRSIRCFDIFEPSWMPFLQHPWLFQQSSWPVLSGAAPGLLYLPATFPNCQCCPAPKPIAFDNQGGRRPARLAWFPHLKLPFDKALEKQA